MDSEGSKCPLPPQGPATNLSTPRYVRVYCGSEVRNAPMPAQDERDREEDNA